VLRLDADKLELLLQAREYQAQGNPLVQPWIDSTMAMLTTRTATALAKTPQDLSPSIWWDEFAAAFGTQKHRAWPATKHACRGTPEPAQALCEN
jgi:putative hydrolase of HD superfamily